MYANQTMTFTDVNWNENSQQMFVSMPVGQPDIYVGPQIMVEWPSGKSINQVTPEERHILCVVAFGVPSRWSSMALQRKINDTFVALGPEYAPVGEHQTPCIAQAWKAIGQSFATLGCSNSRWAELLITRRHMNLIPDGVPLRFECWKPKQEITADDHPVGVHLHNKMALQEKRQRQQNMMDGQQQILQFPGMKLQNMQQHTAFSGNNMSNMNGINSFNGTSITMNQMVDGNFSNLLLNRNPAMIMQQQHQPYANGFVYGMGETSMSPSLSPQQQLMHAQQQQYGSRQQNNMNQQQQQWVASQQAGLKINNGTMNNQNILPQTSTTSSPFSETETHHHIQYSHQQHQNVTNGILSSGNMNSNRNPSVNSTVAAAAAAPSSMNHIPHQNNNLHANGYISHQLNQQQDNSNIPNMMSSAVHDNPSHQYIVQFNPHLMQNLPSNFNGQQRNKVKHNNQQQKQSNVFLMNNYNNSNNNNNDKINNNNNNTSNNSNNSSNESMVGAFVHPSSSNSAVYITSNNNNNNGSENSSHNSNKQNKSVHTHPTSSAVNSPTTSAPYSNPIQNMTNLSSNRNNNHLNMVGNYPSSTHNSTAGPYSQQQHNLSNFQMVMPAQQQQIPVVPGSTGLSMNMNLSKNPTSHFGSQHNTNISPIVGNNTAGGNLHQYHHQVDDLSYHHQNLVSNNNNTNIASSQQQHHNIQQMNHHHQSYSNMNGNYGSPSLMNLTVASTHAPHPCNNSGTSVVAQYPMKSANGCLNLHAPPSPSEDYIPNYPHSPPSVDVSFSINGGVPHTASPPPHVEHFEGGEN